MDSLVWLFLLSVLMFAGAFGAGLLPMLLPLSPRKMNFLMAFSGGLLIGTVFLVILPEGIETFCLSSLHVDQSTLEPPSVNNTSSVTANTPHVHIENMSHAGIAILFGFLLIMLIERVTSFTHQHHPKYDKPVDLLPPSSSSNEALESQQTPPNYQSNSDIDNLLLHTPASLPSAPPSSSFSTMIGLALHSLSDGIALGATSTSPSFTRVQTLVFLAILFHKAPMTFAFGAIMLKENSGNNRKARIKKYVAIVSAAAPVGAIAVGIIIRLCMNSMETDGTDSMEGNSNNFNLWTAYLLLFSAGSFIYVATLHILPEVQQSQELFMRNRDYSKSKWIDQVLDSPWCQGACMVLGMFSPLLLGGHQH